jgi:poly-gamma-glutamate capsule biosynthesis protein CapA/YwtB (metallophosphatase superfamily)
MYGDPPDGGSALFAHVRAQTRAPDLMMVNLEGTYSTGGPSKCSGSGSSSASCFAFQAPPAFARALPRAGIDLVSQANNHANDYLSRGLTQTQAALKKYGVAFTGMPGQIAVVNVKGVKVAVMGFSPYPWNANVNDIPAARRLVEKAAARADVVVVLMHVGAEGADKTHTPRGTEYAFGENRGDPRAFAHAVVDAGADLVLGSGPHVIRGIERYRSRLIAYSLGNFGGWGNFGTGGTLSLSGLLTVRIDAQGRIHGGRWLSLWLAPPGVPTIDPSDASAHLVKRLSREDFSNTFTMDPWGRIGSD